MKSKSTKKTISKKAPSAKKSAAPKKPKTTRVAHSDNSTPSEVIRKKQLKTRNACKVTLTLPAEAVPGASKVTLAGDFNEWSRTVMPLKKLKTGKYSVTVELESGREYRFRFCIDGKHWENHWNADRYEPNPHGGDDSVIVL